MLIQDKRLSKQMKQNFVNSALVKRFSFLVKEIGIVSFWVLLGTLALFGFDAAGLLSGNFVGLVVDFPEVYQVWKDESAVFVDGRTATVFKRGHIPGAINIPVEEVAKRLSALPNDKDVQLIVYCGSASCPLSYHLLKQLQRYNYTNIQIFQRGIEGWLRFGYPLQTSSKP